MPLRSISPCVNVANMLADSLRAHFPLNEGSGTMCADLSRTHYSRGDLELSDAGVWDGTTIDFSAVPSSYGTFWAATGDVLDAVQFGVLAFSDVGDNSSERVLLCSANARATHGAISFYRVNGSSEFRLGIYDAAATLERYWSWTVADPAAEHVLAWSHGRGLIAQLDGMAGTEVNAPSSYLGPIRTPDGESWQLGRVAAGNYAEFIPLGLSIGSDMIRGNSWPTIAADPYILFREPPGFDAEIAAAEEWEAETAYSSGNAVARFGDVVKPSAPARHLYQAATTGSSDVGEPVWPTIEAGMVEDGEVEWVARVPSFFTVWPNPIQARVTATSVLYRWTSSWLLQSATGYWRMRYATTIAGLETATPTTWATVTGPAEKSEITLNVLTQGTRGYAVAEWSPDGIAAYPAPGGVFMVNPMRAS